MAKRESQLYLIHGNNEAEVGNARFELVAKLLTPEERDAGLTEIRGPGNQPLTLQRALSEIIGELGTSSFISGSRRVVVVYDLQDFYAKRRAAKKRAASKTKKAKPKPAGDPVQAFADWVEEILPTTENIAVFVCNENDEKGKMVAAGSPLYDLIARHGQTIQRRDKPLNFELENHIFSLNTTAAVKVLREWIRRAGSDGSGRMKIYSTLSTQVEMLFQARCLDEARKRGVPETQVLDASSWPSLTKMPEWKSKKIRDLSRRYSMQEIRELIESANKLQRLMYPSGEEAYVANWEDFAEVLLIRLTA